jgi:epoxyqueuosine reductase
MTWKLNEKRCASYAMLNKNGAMCNTCVKVCPWSNPNTLPHNLIRWSVQHSELARRIAIKASCLIKSENAEEHNKWWFDY